MRAAVQPRPLRSTFAIATEISSRCAMCLSLCGPGLTRSMKAPRRQLISLAIWLLMVAFRLRDITPLQCDCLGVMDMDNISRQTDRPAAAPLAGQRGFDTQGHGLAAVTL